MPKLAEIISTLPPDQRDKATAHLARLDGAVKRQAKSDNEVASALIRVLKRPNGGIAFRLADELRTLIMGGVCRGDY